MKKRLISGVKPSGELHLGNYLGALSQWVHLQDEYDVFLFVADLHAITVPQQPDVLRRWTLDTVKNYLAAGVDPKKVTIFAQSQVHEHAELCWILNTIARIGDLEKMTQFKDKTNNAHKETAGVGLFDYPVLMAADIMLYDAMVVPVGEDQVQHIELTRTLGRRFNKHFGEVFVLPQPMLQKYGARIMALDNSSKKMSKSSTSEYSYITMNDSLEQARKKIMKAVTDSGTEIVFSDEKPALKNLITIFSILSATTPEEVVRAYRGKGYADFKHELADQVVVFLEMFQSKVAKISDEEVKEILKKGAVKAQLIARKKVDEIKKRIGFLV
jgi:tryptophanyl-tRNA synthetase